MRAGRRLSRRYASCKNSTHFPGRRNMNKMYVILPIALVLTCGVSRADFKYTQQSQITGGALVSMTKTLGVFSKNMRQMNEPQLSTTMVKGNRLRSEHATGEVQVIDLDGRRFIYLDPAKKTYSWSLLTT